MKKKLMDTVKVFFRCSFIEKYDVITTVVGAQHSTTRSFYNRLLVGLFDVLYTRGQDFSNMVVHAT